jgi:ferric-dicitrate binding protein FerR (iron transport regulator)
MLVAGKSAAAAAAWVSVLKAGPVSAEQVWALAVPLAAQVWEMKALEQSAQAPLPVGQAPRRSALPHRPAGRRLKAAPHLPPNLPGASRRPGSPREAR